MHAHTREIAEAFVFRIKENDSLCQRICLDPTISLSACRLRNNRMTAGLYYRGGLLMTLSMKMGTQSLSWHPIDEKHLDADFPLRDAVKSLCPHASDHLARFMGLIPRIKDAMDCGRRIKWEREIQQLTMRINNRCPQLLGVHPSQQCRCDSDFMFTDMEYSQENAKGRGKSKYRFDLIGVEWPASNRRGAKQVRPVIAELKCGVRAFSDNGSGPETGPTAAGPKSGICGHLMDFHAFFTDPDAQTKLADDIEISYFVLHELGLIMTAAAPNSVCVTRPVCLFLLADINPRSEQMERSLQHGVKTINGFRERVNELRKSCDLRYAKGKFGLAIYETESFDVVLSDLLS
jgi:hypothetical protein